MDIVSFFKTHKVELDKASSELFRVYFSRPHCGHDHGQSVPPALIPVQPSPADVPGTGYPPSGPTTSDGKVEPMGTPTAGAVVEKIDTESKAQFMNLFLHVMWSQVENATDGIQAAEKEKMISVHSALVEKMQSRGWVHTFVNALDNTLPPHLKVVIGPQPASGPTPGMPEREKVVVAPIGLAGQKPFSIKDGLSFPVALPEVSTKTCVKLSYNDALAIVQDKESKPSFELPIDGLFLLLDAVEEGIFNNVRISKEEMEKAAIGYPGRMFVEGHDWNDPRRAIGQILKAKVVFKPETGKWTMQVLAVVLRDDAISAFTKGLYKFVSIGATMKAVCSVCGLTMQEGCRHEKGRVYDGPRGKQMCFFDARDLQMEELSAVNVPACRPAGVTGKVSIEEARNLLAAALEQGSHGSLHPLEYMMGLQEIIYCQDEEEFSMADWKKEFRIEDAKGYNALLQRTEQYPHLGRVFGDLARTKKVPTDTDAEVLSFAHELLHRWFNQPTRAKSWSEDDIAEKHAVLAALMRQHNVVHGQVTVMDDALHSKASFFAAKCEGKPAEECGKEEPLPEKDGVQSDKISGKTEDGAKKSGDSSPDDSCEKCESEGKTGECTHKVVSFNDAEERRAGYQDGVAKAQAGATSAQGKQANQGADLNKGADYRKGYQQGYKEAQKTNEPDYVDAQIAKGGINMSVTGEEKVVLTKSETTTSGAVKDLGTRKEQGEMKPEVKQTDPDKAQVDKDKKLGGVSIESTHNYDPAKGEHKADVQKQKVDKDGDTYGYLKCPKCNQGNIMADSAKCPRCGAPRSELIPIKEEERMGDFPVQKTHSAYDTPPMDAKNQNPSNTPEMKKMSADENTRFATLSEEVHALKMHLTTVNSNVNKEREAWLQEKQALVNEYRDLNTQIANSRTEIEALKLDLGTKDSMIKTLSAENQSLLKKLELYTKTEKDEIIEKILNAKASLGVALTDEQKSEHVANYSSKPIETLRVVLDELTASVKHFAKVTMSQRFGVPETTEAGKVSEKEGVVASEKDAVLKQIQDKAEVDKAEAKGQEDVGENTIMGKILHSLNKSVRK